MAKYFSQHNEEYLIKKYVGDKKDGKYVDIGAGSARDLSNTYYFYTQGWNGMCFEPTPSQDTHEHWRQVRPNDIFFDVALSDHEGEIEMISTGSVDSFVGHIYRDREYPGQQRMVKCTTFNKILQEFPEYKEVDFMSLDVDTYEDKILAGMDLSVFKPKLIVIEYMVRNKDFRYKWEHLILPYYEQKELIAGNAFYLRKPNT